MLLLILSLEIMDLISSPLVGVKVVRDVVQGGGMNFSKSPSPSYFLLLRIFWATLVYWSQKVSDMRVGSVIKLPSASEMQEGASYVFDLMLMRFFMPCHIFF